MGTNELFGLLFFAALGLGIVIGLRALSRKRVSTEQEFERNASDSASSLGSAVRVMQGMIDPAEGRSEQVVRDLKQGHYNKAAGAAEGPEAGRGSGKQQDRGHERRSTGGSEGG